MREASPTARLHGDERKKQTYPKLLVSAKEHTQRPNIVEFDRCCDHIFAVMIYSGRVRPQIDQLFHGLKRIMLLCRRVQKRCPRNRAAPVFNVRTGRSKTAYNLSRYSVEQGSSAVNVRDIGSAATFEQQLDKVCFIVSYGVM